MRTALLAAGAAVTMAFPNARAQSANGVPALTRAQQITVAVLPLPVDLRETATVYGYGDDGKLTLYRQGTGDMTCLGPNRQSNRFHVACYHKSMEPFMARGRELRAQGVTGNAVDSVRFQEARSGKLVMPTQPASLYSLTGEWTTLHTDSLTAQGARPLFVIYVPFATGKTTGLSEKPARGTPWLMNPGTPKAHIMFVPEM